MVTTIEKAIEVQQRRFAAGRPRLAGAVKRFLKREVLKDEQVHAVLEHRIVPPECTGNDQ